MERPVCSYALHVGGMTDTLASVNQDYTWISGNTRSR